jgi:hypothetical protein
MNTSCKAMVMLGKVANNRLGSLPNKLHQHRRWNKKEHTRMVKGHRPSATPPRPRDPVDLGASPAAEPCAHARVLTFALETLADIGTEIHLVPVGEIAWVVAATGRIGTVPARAISDIWNCIADGWAYVGTISSIVDDDATALVRGQATR